MPEETRVEDWALVGSPDQVAEGIALYRARLGMTHMIARTHVPGAEAAEIERSVEEIAALDRAL